MYIPGNLFVLCSLFQYALSAPFLRNIKYGSLVVQTSNAARSVLGERPAIFLVGYEASTKPAVASRLISLGGRVLQNLPYKDHWLTHTTPAALESLQREFPSVTTALLPEQAKVTPALQRLINETRQYGSVVEQGTSLPDWLHKFVMLREGKDGHAQIMLSIDRPAFTTVEKAYCSDCPERNEAKRAAEAWARVILEGMAAVLSPEPGNACHPVIQSSSALGIVKMAVCLHQTEHAVTWLAKQGEVVSVSIVSILRPANLHAGRAVQSGAHQLGLPDDYRTNDAQRKSLFPFWAANITGMGQVVGIADTGIDLSHCSFWDPACPDYQNDSIKNVTDSEGNRFVGFVSTKHRKVQSYLFFQDKSDDPWGHGTHVAGTAAGSLWDFDPVTSPDLATGVAPHSRIAFFDIGTAAGYLYPPSDLASILRVLHKQGARIVSNSWGDGDIFAYSSSYCKEIDSFAFVHDQLIFFAAGNNYDLANVTTGTTGTVISPANCKNVLAIGSTDNHYFARGTPTQMINDAGQQINFTNIRASVFEGFGASSSSDKTPYDFVSWFSAYGNADLGYIMPQLVAPGNEILSADAGSTAYDSGQKTCCSNVTSWGGTSMATPVAAGAAVLMRQYFVDGFYPSGHKVPENGFDPSASLLMATLVAGASDMRGAAMRNGKNLTLYDENQGFGRVDLSRSLPLASVTNPSWKLKVWQRNVFFSENEAKGFNLSTIGDTPVVIALAWMDLPTQSGDGEPLLRNDLDLKVVAPNGTEIWGNDRLNGDRSNNIEKVVVESPDAGDYTIIVTSVSIDIVEGPQSYSVVALGGIDDKSFEWDFPSSPPPSPESPSPSPTPPPLNPLPGPEPTSPPPQPSPAPPSRTPPDASPQLSPPVPASPVAPFPPELDATLQVNERQVDVVFVVDMSKDDLGILGDTGSRLYREFKEATESLFAREMDEKSKVLLLALTIATTRRRTLQSATIMGRYILQGSSREGVWFGAQRIMAKLNEDGARYLDGSTSRQFKIISTSATDTTPRQGQGASGGDSGDRARVLGPAVGVPVGVTLVWVVLMAYLYSRRRAPSHTDWREAARALTFAQLEPSRRGTFQARGASSRRTPLSVLGGWVKKGGLAVKRLPRLTRGSRIGRVSVQRNHVARRTQRTNEEAGSTWKRNPLAALHDSKG